MKKGILAAIFSMLWLGSVAGVAFADSSTVEMQSRILDAFNGAPYLIDGESFHYTWKAVASRYTTKTDSQSFPQIGIVDTAPVQLTRIAADKNGAPDYKGDNEPTYGTVNAQTNKSLGIQGSFDRQGYNWIDVYPTLDQGDGNPVEIPLLGRTRVIDMWVWGSNLNYALEAYIRDDNGVIHNIPMGSLKYTGWKDLRVSVPADIPQVRNTIPRTTHGTTFVKFRIWTDPTEKTYSTITRTITGKIVNVMPFYVYFAQFKVLTDTYETTYDGDQLADPKFVTNLWKQGDSGAQSQGDNAGTAGATPDTSAAPAAGGQ
jgi:hypothetical protein